MPEVRLLCSARRPARPASHVSFHADGKGGLLFDSHSQAIFSLDQAAAFLWCSLADDRAPADVVPDYANRAGIGVEEAIAHLSGTIDRWRTAGLLSDAIHPTRTVFSPPLQPRRGAIPRRAVALGPAVVACQILDSRIATRFSDARLAGHCAPIIDRLRTSPPTAWTAIVDVRRFGRGAMICSLGQPPLEVPDPRGVAPALIAALVRIGLQQCSGFPAAHAALVSMPGGAVLFPAPSQRGKSTLSAALMSAGYETLCDDTVVLDRLTLEARPVIPYICLKSGSWTTVGARMPSLWRRPALRRLDGKHVRYVETGPRVAVGRGLGARQVPVTALVFARYSPGIPSECRPVGTHDALRHLLPSLDPIGQAFEPEDVDRLIRWVDGMPCYELRHATVEDGIAAVTEIAPCRPAASRSMS